MKHNYLFLILLIGSFAFGQVVNIPDANFKAKLLSANASNTIAYQSGVGYAPIDTNGNGEIEISEAATITRIDVSNSSINSLVGIAAFYNVTNLNCSTNALTTLDVNALLNLRYLNCSYNQLTILDANATNDKIREFNCSHNNLTSLIVPNFFAFQDMGDQDMRFDASHNQLSEITFNTNDGHEDLSLLNLSDNNFTDLTLSNIVVYGSVNLSNNPLNNLTFNNCYIGSQGPDDHCSLSVSNTNLTQLTIPRGGNLYLNIKDNPNLVSLDMKNGSENVHFVYDHENETYTIEGVTLDNNPMLAMICCDADEVGYLSSIVPNAQITEYCSFTPGGNYSTITGTVTVNCPSGVAVDSNIKVTVNNLYNANFTNDEGSYTAYTSYGNQTIAVSLPNPAYFTVTPPNYIFYFTSENNLQTANFCLTPNGTHPDLELIILPLTPARPGFDATYKILYTNKGTEIQSGSVAFNFDESILDFVSSDATATQTPGTLTWDFTDLAPFETRTITCKLNLNSPMETPAVNNDDILNFVATVSSEVTDETPDNNNYTLAQTVVGSYDPNDKIATEGSTIDISRVGDYLHYMIRFQNTGTYAAENVVVKDTFQFTSLDATTIQIIGASHPFRSIMTSNTLEAIFENINLPSTSVNEPGSHGYFAFKIKTRPGLEIGRVIDNSAKIYFDYNFPIITNTMSTTVTALGNPSFSADEFVIYPNPVKSTFSIQSNATIRNIGIYNTLGQLVKTIQINESQIDISDLNNGTYFIRLESDKGKTTKKIIKL